MIIISLDATKGLEFHGYVLERDLEKEVYHLLVIGRDDIGRVAYSSPKKEACEEVAAAMMKTYDKGNLIMDISKHFDENGRLLL